MHQSPPAFLLAILPLIGDVDEDSRNWPHLLAETGRYLESKAVGLVSHDFSLKQGSIPYASGYNLKYLQTYERDAARHNVWLSREQDYRRPGRIHIGKDLVPEGQLVETEFYQDWLRPQDLHHRLCAVLRRAGSSVVLLEALRPRDSRGFDQGDVDRLRALLPHFQVRLRIERRMTELKMKRDAAVHALDRLPWGVVLVDDRGQRLVANRRAEEILVAGDGLVMKGNYLRAVLTDEAVRLGHLLDQALHQEAEGPEVGGTLPITRTAGGHPLSVQVFPLRTSAGMLGDRKSAAAIFISDPDLRLSSNEQHLRELYALTPVEARLAASIAQGRSVDEAALEMGISRNTARAYVKRIFHKTGVRRQAELVRLMLSASLS